jgi:anionic cell wall polymer biosynthesis LytR-Cps2A-Psr (LCP) family protein
MSAIVNFLIEIVSKGHYVRRKFGQVHSVVDALVGLDAQFQKALADGKMSKAEASRIEGRLKDLLTSLKGILP